MANYLTVWIANKAIGKLTVEQGRWHFVYSSSWLTDERAYAISPHLSLQENPFIDSADDKRVEWFFENLLPEGGMREALARQAMVSKNDVFQLIARYGQESAGAVTILPEDEQLPAGSYDELGHDELHHRISQSTDIPLLSSSDDLHMSLAGVQNKLGVLYKDNQFYLPKGNAASSHIIKPDNVSVNFPFCPANEYFCMRLAEAIGLPVPTVSLLHIPDALFIINRFDRIVTNQGVERIHQIDLCQLLNKWLGYKYESHGGITINDLFESINQLAQPAVAREKILHWIIFSFIIANTDAHGKNISFIVKKNAIILAPFYDLLCVQAYLPDSRMAMSISNETNYGWIEQIHWDVLAKAAGVPKSLIYSYIERISKKVNTEIKLLPQLSEFTENEKQFIEANVIPVIKKQLNYLDFSHSVN